MGVCICVYVLSHVQLFALEQWLMGVCVCVLSHVQLFALEQSHMGVCVCVCSVMSDSLHWSCGGWVCVCVCLRAQLCQTFSTRAVADGCVCVCVLSCVRLFVLEQWPMVYASVCSILSNYLHWSSGIWGFVCVCACMLSHI